MQGAAAGFPMEATRQARAYTHRGARFLARSPTHALIAWCSLTRTMCVYVCVCVCVCAQVGGKPHKLDIPGAELCITSDEALELPACPQKVRAGVAGAGLGWGGVGWGGVVWVGLRWTGLEEP